MLQHIGRDSRAKRVGDDNDLVEAVFGEDLRDREAGILPVERGASNPIADREHLIGGFSLQAGRERREKRKYLYDNDAQARVFFRELPNERKVGQQPNLRTYALADLSTGNMSDVPLCRVGIQRETSWLSGVGGTSRAEA